MMPMSSDRSRPFHSSDGPLSETLCYPITKHISSFLDKPHVRRTLGVDADYFAGRNFSSLNYDVNTRFAENLDSVVPSPFYIAALLERGVRTLIYVGANDWICNWVSFRL